MRSEADQYLEAIDEAMRIGREGGVPVEIYHLKAGGVRNWPKAAQAVAKIDSARAARTGRGRGHVSVRGGRHRRCRRARRRGPPKVTSCSTACAIPPRARGSSAEMKAARKHVGESVRAGDAGRDHDCRVTRSRSSKQYEGKRIVGDRDGACSKDWANTIVELLLATEARVGMLVFMMSEPNVEMQMRQPWMKFGTDADGSDPDSAKGLTHPRAYGTYPRILGHYVRERRVLSLEEAIRKMTSAVANTTVDSRSWAAARRVLRRRRRLRSGDRDRPGDVHRTAPDTRSGSRRCS